MIISLVTRSSRKEGVVRVCSLNDHKSVGETRRRCRKPRGARATGMATSEIIASVLACQFEKYLASRVTCGPRRPARLRPFRPSRGGLGSTDERTIVRRHHRWQAPELHKRLSMRGCGPTRPATGRNRHHNRKVHWDSSEVKCSMGKSRSVNDLGRKLSCPLVEARYASGRGDAMGRPRAGAPLLPPTGCATDAADTTRPPAACPAAGGRPVGAPRGRPDHRGSPGSCAPEASDG